MFDPHAIRTSPSGDVTLAYRSFGLPPASGAQHRAPVLFVHGLSYFSYDWVEFGTKLCSDRSGCAMDMRGFGDSSYSPSQDYAASTMGNDIAKLLDHLGWEKVILVAHSMGGRGAACFAQTHPARTSGLVLVDWSPENAPAGSRRVATSVANTPDVFPDVEAVMRYFGIDADSPEGAAKRPRFEAYTRPAGAGVAIKRDPYFRDQFKRQLETGIRPPMPIDLWEVIGKLTAPTLVLRATRSDLFAAETLPKVLQKNPRIQAQEIEAGHNIIGDNPAAAHAAIRSFIDTLEQA